MITIKFSEDVDFDTIDFYMINDDEQYEFIFKNGDKYYYKNRYLHNDSGPAVIEVEDKNKEWQKEGKLSNTKGPAIINESNKVYAIDGKLTNFGSYAIIRYYPEYYQYERENWDDGKFINGVYKNGKVSTTPHFLNELPKFYTQEKQREKKDRK